VETAARSADDKVGFGAYVDDNVVTVRYRDVRLRKLTKAPTPAQGGRSEH
jgi:hypothetical protein